MAVSYHLLFDSESIDNVVDFFSLRTCLGIFYTSGDVVCEAILFMNNVINKPGLKPAHISCIDHLYA